MALTNLIEQGYWLSMRQDLPVTESEMNVSEHRPINR